MKTEIEASAGIHCIDHVVTGLVKHWPSQALGLNSLDTRLLLLLVSDYSIS
jgi:hypothetical protein